MDDRPMKSELENVILKYGVYVPKEQRMQFYEDLAALMDVSGNKAVDDFIERFKKSAVLE